MANTGPNINGSFFMLTAKPECLGGKHVDSGKEVEGLSDWVANVDSGKVVEA